MTGNGASNRAKGFARVINATASRHRYVGPDTPRHNGKVECYNRTLAEELLYARVWTSAARRAEEIQRWNIRYNYHRDRTATWDRPPATRLKACVANVASQGSSRGNRLSRYDSQVVTCCIQVPDRSYADREKAA